MSILLFIVVLLLLVLVHELGHFLIAKLARIRVDEFAFGFPPRLFSVKKGETTYAFNLLPIGGYVKIYGENPDEVHPSERERSFGGKSRWIQAAVVIAGVVFNLVLAWILIAMTFMIGITAPVENSSGFPVSDPKMMITETAKGGPADVAGIKSGDILLQVSDGVETVVASTPEAISRFVGTKGEIPLNFFVERNRETFALTITPVQGISTNGPAIGIYMDMVGTLRLDLLDALSHGFTKTYEFTKLTAVGIVAFLSEAIIGDADFSTVTGPVGIVNEVGNAAGLGFANLLLLTALISINLAIINVLPFPALDGGRLLFIAIEGVMRRPIKAVYANTVNVVGFALLMLLMVVVTYHDIVRLF